MTTPEKVLWEGRPSWWTVWPSLLIGDLILLLAPALWWADYRELAPLAVAASLPFYLLAVLKRASARYTVTDQRVRASLGLFARRVDEVEVCDIRNVILTQTFFERLVGTGTVGLSTSAGDGIEVVLVGVPEAEAVKEAVRQGRLVPPKPGPEGADGR
ncbi:MAG: hypothetical protein FD126_2243 [Elusimicrobia bacterium]|nr:MAG: hypothetical protein FD126_2243 [Elusimicrobiota bacterium]